MSNLAIADLLACILCVIEIILSANDSYTTCQIFIYFEYCNICSEWMSLAFISFIRCLTVTNHKRWKIILTKSKLVFMIFGIRFYGLFIIIFLSLDVRTFQMQKWKKISSNFISGLWRISVLYFQTYMLFSNGNRLNVSDTLFNYNHQFGIYLALYSENYKLCQGNRNWVMQHNTRVQLPICN